MKRILLIGAMCFAVGCGGDELFHPEAPADCPVSRDGEVFATVRFRITEWEAEARSGDRAAIAVTYPGWEHPPHRSSSSLQALTKRKHTITNSSYVVPRNTRMTIELWTDTDLHGETLADTAVVKIDRECDLVVEAAQRGDALPHIENIRWENPYL